MSTGVDIFCRCGTWTGNTASNVADVPTGPVEGGRPALPEATVEGPLATSCCWRASAGRAASAEVLEPACKKKVVESFSMSLLYVCMYVEKWSGASAISWGHVCTGEGQ